MDPISWWIWSVVGAGVVIVVVAVLLGLIIAAAKSVDQHARRIWLVGKQIAGNTVSIWVLESVEQRLEHASQSTRKLERSAASINESLRALSQRS